MSADDGMDFCSGCRCEECMRALRAVRPLLAEDLRLHGENAQETKGRVLRLVDEALGFVPVVEPFGDPDAPEVG